MHRAPKSSGNFALVLIALLLAYHFRAQILAWLSTNAPSLASIVAPVLAPSVPLLGTPGDNNFFGGTNATANPAPNAGFTELGLPPGIRSSVTGRPSNVGPGQDDNSASNSPYVFINTSRAFGSGCSTHLWDKKPLCE